MEEFQNFWLLWQTAVKFESLQCGFILNLFVWGYMFKLALVHIFQI